MLTRKWFRVYVSSAVGWFQSSASFSFLIKNVVDKKWEECFFLYFIIKYHSRFINIIINIKKSNHESFQIFFLTLRVSLFFIFEMFWWIIHVHLTSCFFQYLTQNLNIFIDINSRMMAQFLCLKLNYIRDAVNLKYQ